MKDNKTCVIFPIHEPKFEYGYSLIKSFNKYYVNNEIFLVFSDVNESLKFNKLFPELIFNSIVYPFEIDSAIVNKKKFFGLNFVFEETRFEYAICIDSECLFIKKVNLDKICDDFYFNKRLFSNLTIKSDFIHKIITSPQLFFNKSEQNLLSNKLKDNSLYFWFNEMPIYKKDVFQRFQKKVNFKKNFELITWYDFDFILYGYHCILEENFELVQINNQLFKDGSFLENQNQINYFRFLISLFKIKPSWLIKKIYFYRKAFIIFHLDRNS